jgi:RHS repeat-associated protein
LPTSETLNYGGVNYSIGRSYDANGSLSQLTYPDNFSVAYNPNALGEARQAGGYATAVYYHPNGAVKQFSYGNGIAHTLAQNLRGLPQLSQDGSVLKDSYTYDQNANVASITDQVEGVTTRNMEYDGLNRLTHVNASALWGDAWYGYDALDNLTSSQVTAGAKARTLTHNINYSNNRLDSVSGSYTLGYQYDSQGNIILRGGQSYSFDIGNRMRSAPGITTHAYDGLGRRTSVVGTDGVNHIYVYGQEGKLLYETTTGQALASGTKYVYLNRHVVAEVSGGGVVYDHTDGLGSPVAKTSSTAGLISRTRYEPYGATAAGTEPTIGFTGHLNAANLGLVDMQQRFYDPVAGRFLSIDPVVTDANTATGFNRYSYAADNPYRYVDPDGRQVQNSGDRISESWENERIRKYRQAEEPISFAAGEPGKGKPKPNKSVMTGNAYIDEATTQLNTMALIAMAAAGDGKGPVYGTKVHSIFAELVRNSGRPDLHAELSFSFSGLIEYGFAGSIRTDVILGPDPERPVAIYDLKTGSARLNDRRVQEINSRFPGVLPRPKIFAIYPIPASEIGE